SGSPFYMLRTGAQSRPSARRELAPSPVAVTLPSAHCAVVLAPPREHERIRGDATLARDALPTIPHHRHFRYLPRCVLLRCVPANLFPGAGRRDATSAAPTMRARAHRL